MIEFESKLVKTDVTCIKCFQKFIFTGIGGNIHLFEENGKLLQIFSVFPSQRIYGIIPNKRNHIAVYGSNKIKILEFNFLLSKITNAIHSRDCEDWILDLKWIDNDQNIVTVFANNYVSLWTNNLSHSHKVACEQRCLLYSACFWYDTWESLKVFSGTVFSEILVWLPSENPFYCPVWHRLVGHDGVIFSINIHEPLNIIITTSDDRTVRFWDQTKLLNAPSTLQPTHTLYGHLARVFKTIVTDNKIISSGEDSNIHVWNTNGELIKKFDAHQNGCVWTLDSIQNRLVSGGGDSGVSIYPIGQEFKMAELTVVETPKIIKILTSGNIVVVTESGLLKTFDKNENIWKDVRIHEDLKSYTVMAISENRQLLALGGFHGNIHIYKEKNNQISKICSATSENLSRIFSIHFLTSDMLLTSENDGKIQIWQLSEEENRLKQIEEFVLPPSKERWATCGVLLNTKVITVGDRKGNIHLFKFGTREVAQSVKKAHNHLGITNLCSVDNQLISMGRNGVLKKFNYSPETNLTQITSDKLPFSWLTAIHQQNNLTLIVGFTGSNFVIWDHNNRRILHEINCGGGHRSYDFHIKNSTINFVYIKEKIIHTFTCDFSEILTVNLVEGYHTKEINTLVMSKMDEHNLIVVSGGEDTTVRLSTVNLRLEQTKFESVSIFKSHLSSVRCIKMFPIERNYIMISVGGRAQIIVWKLTVDQNKGKFKVNCYETASYYKELEENESEIRVMDLTLIPYDKVYLLLTACSDGTIRCYKINPLLELKYFYTITYALKCIMKIEYIKICKRDVIVTMATDGKIVFWDFTNFYEKQNYEQFYTLPVHQSAVNAFDYVLKENKVLFATGGDDNAIVINLVKFEFIDKFNVTFLSKSANFQSHGAKVSGIFIYDNYCISTSTDQDVSVLKFDNINDELKCEIVKRYSSVIADIQGMNCVKCDGGLYVCLFGKGIEIIKIKFKL